MESLRPEFAHYASKNKCARTDTAFFPISQVCTRGVTLSDGGDCKTAPATPGVTVPPLVVLAQLVELHSLVVDHPDKSAVSL